MIPDLPPIQTVGELRAALTPFTDETPIAGAWEGQRTSVFVYQAEDGTVLLDEDDCHYRARNQGLKCEACDKQAVNILNGIPTCWDHWPKAV